MKDGRPRVMVLDADPESLAEHYRMLTDRGYGVATFSDPAPACAYAAGEEPDAIVTSLGFPGCDGLDVVRRLKEASPKSHLLLLARLGELPPLGAAARAGAEVLLPSSHGSEVLWRHLEEALGERPASAGR